MDLNYVKRLIFDKLRDAETYWIAGLVGTLINAFGHLLVPWIRGSEDPWAILVEEFQAHPALTIFSILLAYAFPLLVGVTSSVLTRYRNRRIESVADFPERKPDPVFRANRTGDFVEVGASTREFFREFNVDSAKKILGTEIWSEIAVAKEPGGGKIISFEPEGADYVVSYTPTANDKVNVYMTRLLPN
jgi:hypothetical protein